MTELALADDRALRPKRDQTVRGPVGRIRQAIDLMCHDGLTDSQAAVQVGTTIDAIRSALKRPGVRAYLHEQRHVSRERICARNIHRLAQIRDAADNMPAVNAIKVLEQLGESDDAGRGAARSAPGLVIVIQGAAAASPAPAGVTIEHAQIGADTGTDTGTE